MSVYRPGYHQSTMCLPSRFASWMVDSAVNLTTHFTLTPRLPSISKIGMVDKLVDTREGLKSAVFSPLSTILPSTILRKRNKKEGGEYAATKNTRVGLVVGSHANEGLSA